MWNLEEGLVLMTLLYLTVITFLTWLQIRQRPTLVDRGTDARNYNESNIRAADSTVLDGSQDLFQFHDLESSPEY